MAKPPRKPREVKRSTNSRSELSDPARLDDDTLKASDVELARIIA